MFRLPLLTLFAIVAQAQRVGSLTTSSLRGDASDREDPSEAVRSVSAEARSDVVLATVLSPGGGINAAEYYMLEGGGDEEDELDEEALWHLEQIDNVMVPQDHEIDVEGNDQHGRMLLSVSSLELQNAGYIQSTRVRRGKQRVAWASDLLAEAQRWSRRMARLQAVSYRNPLNQNVNPGWRKLAEIDGQDTSVAYQGMFSQFMKSNRSSSIVLDNAYNRLGVGIAKNATKYYVCYLFKAVIVT
jgi:Cysteine-rich secretory protein family